MNRKMLKFGLIAAAALVGLVALVLTTLAFIIDPNDYKSLIVKIVQEKKQRTLNIEGAIKLTLFPKLGVDLGKTQLSEHKSAETFASIDSLKLYVAWWPLLHNELVVDSISVDGARARLIRYADGSTNIDDLLSKDEPAQLKFDIDGVKIAHSALSVDDRLGNRKLQLTEFTMKSGRLRENAHTNINLAFRLDNDRPQVTGKIEMKSGLLFDLTNKRYVFDDLKFRLTGRAFGVEQVEMDATGGVDTRFAPQSLRLEHVKLHVKGKLGADKLDFALDAPKLMMTPEKVELAALTLEGRIEQSSGTLKAVLRAPDMAGDSHRFTVSQLVLEFDGTHSGNKIRGELRSPLSGSLQTQSLRLAQLDAQLALSGPKLPKGVVQLALSGDVQLELSKQQVAADLRARFDDSTMRVKLSAEPLNNNPHLRFDADIDRLDLDRYMPTKAQTANAQGDSPIDLSSLRSLNASGTVRIGQLKAANLKSTNVRLELTAGGGRMAFNPASANLYQGSLQGVLSATAARRSRRGSAAGSLRSPI